MIQLYMAKCKKKKRIYETGRSLGETLQRGEESYFTGDLERIKKEAAYAVVLNVRYFYFFSAMIFNVKENGKYLSINI